MMDNQVYDFWLGWVLIVLWYCEWCTYITIICWKMRTKRGDLALNLLKIINNLLNILNILNILNQGIFLVPSLTKAGTTLADYCLPMRLYMILFKSVFQSSKVCIYFFDMASKSK